MIGSKTLMSNFYSDEDFTTFRHEYKELYSIYYKDMCISTTVFTVCALNRKAIDEGQHGF